MTQPPTPFRSTAPLRPWAWAHNPKLAGAATIAALLVMLMLIGLEAALGRDGRGLEFEDLPGFYAVAGLAAALFALAIGLGLRAILVRTVEPGEAPSGPALKGVNDAGTGER